MNAKNLFYTLTNSTRNRQVYNIAGVTFIAISFIIFRATVGGNIDKFISEKLISLGQSKSETNYMALSSISQTGNLISYSSGSSLLRQDIITGPEDIITSSKVTTVDPRVVAMRKFLIDYNSPMYPYAETFVTEADKVGLDWRLVASISGVESAFGRYTPYETNNGWGWKGGINGSFSDFPTWGQGISTVTKGLAYGYGTTTTPYQIEPVYCPPCGQNPRHEWAGGVVRFMNELNYYLENIEKI